MPLADWIRASLWAQPDWRQALGALCTSVVADTMVTAPRLSDLAAACELVEPDRRRALQMHESAWRLGNDPASLERAFELAWELGDHDAIASLGLLAYETTRDAAHLVTAATAYLDGNRPAFAEAPLALAVSARPRDDEAKALLAMAKKQVRDPTAEISSWVARATRANGRESGRLYLQAARLARLAGLDAIYLRHTETAYQRGDRSAALLIEADLLARRRADDLMAFYRRRVEESSGDREWADSMRAAGTRLIQLNVQRGLALRMLRSGLESAYRARLTDIPGHLATWDLLARYARESRSTRELLPLVAEASALPLADDDQLFLARFAIEIIRQELRDENAATPYLATIAKLYASAAEVEPRLPPSEQPNASVASIPSPSIPSFRSIPSTPSIPSISSPGTKTERAERVVIPADVLLRRGGDTFSALVRDLSTTGIYVVTEHDLDVDSTVTVVIEVPQSGMLEVTRHEVQARIVRRAYSGYGMMFVDPAPSLVAALDALTAPHP